MLLMSLLLLLLLAASAAAVSVLLALLLLSSCYSCPWGLLGIAGRKPAVLACAGRSGVCFSRRRLAYVSPIVCINACMHFPLRLHLTKKRVRVATLQSQLSPSHPGMS